MNKTTEPKCSEHPDAPHGFDRNASHNANRYVCECEGWEPDEPVKPSQLADASLEPVAEIKVSYTEIDGESFEVISCELDCGLHKLYAAPVDAKAIREALANARAEALEEAAQECDAWATVKPFSDFSSGSAAGARNCAAAIRGLK